MVTTAQRVRRVAALLAVISAMILSGCGKSPETSSQINAETGHNGGVSENVPADFDTTFRWIPDSVFDVSSPEGTFVRAFVESFELANAGGSTRWGYPGFAEAAPSNIAQMISVYPSTVSDSRPGVGTVFFTGLRRIDDGAWTRLVLCRYGYRSVRETTGRHTDWLSGMDSPRPVEIDFRRGLVVPPTAVKGTARTPGARVFGDWYATRYDFAAVYPTPTADQLACAAQVPASVPRRAPVRGPQPWKPMAPSPGWSSTAVL
ncbi:hypothetical protein [Gordonia sp. NPDC003429]